MPLIYPWRTAYGEDSAIQTVLCCMTSGGIEGWGESAPLAGPLYSPEWASGVFSVCKHWLAPALVGNEISSGQELQDFLSIFKGNPFGKAALDTAWWSLESNIKEVKQYSTVPVALGFGISTKIHLAEVNKHADAGIIGSALVNIISNSDENTVVQNATDFLKELQ